MESENRIVKHSNIKEFDLSQAISYMTTELGKKIAKNGKISFNMIPLAAFCATRTMCNTNKDITADWNCNIGGNISKATGREIKKLYKLLEGHVKELEIYNNINDVPLTKNGNSERYLNNIQIFEEAISEYNQLLCIQVKYSYKKEDLFNMLLSFDEEKYFDDDEEYDINENIKRVETYRRFINEELNLFSLIRNAIKARLTLYVAKKILNNYTKYNITEEDAKYFYIYAKRIHDFTVENIEIKNKFSYESLEKLPVCVSFETENIIVSERDSNISDVVNVIFKLDMLNAPRSGGINKNKPSKHNQVMLNNTQICKMNDYNQKIWLGAKCLFQYIDTGKFDENSYEYEIKTDYTRLANILASYQQDDEDEYEIFLCQSTAISHEVINNNTNPSKRWDKYFYISDEMPETGKCIPVKINMNSKSYGRKSILCNTTNTTKTLMYLHKEDGLFSQITLMNLTDEILLNYIKKNKDMLFDSKTMQIISQQPYYGNSEINKAREQKSKQYTDEEIIIYDMLKTVASVCFVCSAVFNASTTNGNKQIDVFLPRFSSNGKPEGDEIGPVLELGSEVYMTAEGYSFEQVLSSDILRVHTQGYVLPYMNSYKFENAKSSILSDLPFLCRNGDDNALLKLANSVGYIYLTKRKCDYGHGRDALSVVCTKASMIINHSVIQLQNTTEIVDDYDAYSFARIPSFFNTISKMKDNGVNLVIFAMDAPITANTTESVAPGVNNENMMLLENNFKDIAFFPVLLSRFQVKYDKNYIDTKTLLNRTIILQSLHKKANGQKVPLFAEFMGRGIEKSVHVERYKTGTLYQTYRDYYKNEFGEYTKTGNAICEYMKEKSVIRNRIISAITILHRLSNEKMKTDGDEGRNRIAGPLKDKHMRYSIVEYKTQKKNIKVNVMALTAAIFSCIKEDALEE